MLKEKTAVVCGAKDKANCRYHHPEKYAAQKHEKEVNTFFNIKTLVEQPKNEIVSSKTLINNALTSSLKWGEEKPSWWEKFTKDLTENTHLSTTAELVDVINSPEGSLAVVWQHESQNETDFGMNLESGYRVKVCSLKSMETGEDLGFINMVYVTDESFKRTFGDDEFTPFRYQERYDGVRYGFRDYGNYGFNKTQLTGDELLQRRREIWLTATKSSKNGIRLPNGEYIFPSDITKEHIPDDKTVAKDLKKYAKKFNEQIANKKQFHVVPHVDFSSVERPLKGQGYGTALYVYTARMLAKENKVIRGSGVQTGDGQDMWERFKKNFPNQVKQINLPYNGKMDTYHTFDFRK